jgi:hypothetical protein
MVSTESRAICLSLHLLLGVLLLSSPALPAEKEALRVHFSNEVPEIDGALVEPLWQQAAHIAALTQAEPVAGAISDEPTEVWVSFDHHALYIAVRAHVSSPTRIRASSLNRDNRSESDDEITVVIDPFNSRQQGYAFTVNPLGHSMCNVTYAQTTKCNASVALVLN